MGGKIVILTGAGISAESGLKTFRDNNGLWENHSIYEVATPEAFAANPSLVQKFYNQRRAQLISDEVQANMAQKALARLEQNFDGEVIIVTQNVDDLHERAGSKNVLHMHGELLKVKCTQTGISYPWRNELTEEDKCECCELTQTLRPDIVWFGEEVYHMDEIHQHLSDCTYFISIGTSGQVYPASQFVTWAPSGAKTYEVNMEQTQISALFQKGFYGKATEQVPSLVEKRLRIE